MNTTYSKARIFVYRNARPLDIARWQYHFEDGSKESVLTALAVYQNEDGGFGHALEPDLWNPYSSPITTASAVEILREIDFYDLDHNIIKGILKFLASGAFYTQKGWFQKISSNNDFPHAPWWGFSKEKEAGFNSEWEYNPTAVLVGFILKTADKKSDIYKTGLRISIEAIKKIKKGGVIEEHEIGCYCRLLDCLVAANISDKQLDITEISQLLRTAIHNAIETDIDKWTGYVAKPSQYFNTRDSIFYADNKDIAEYECEYIVKTQLDDGSWNIPWNWSDYIEEWVISKNWWKSNCAILNMLYLKGLGKL